MQSKLSAFIYRQANRRDVSLSDVDAALIRELSATVLPSENASRWQRRPSISLDGTPIILSQKIGRTENTGLRLLVEPGSLRMSVAQQIAFSLSRFDRLLGLLGWRDAVADINSITTRVFPRNPSETSDWWGGIWLGATVMLPSGSGADSSIDLRLYVNLRHGTAAMRWRNVATLVSLFAPSSFEPVLNNWVSTVSPHAIPVGLGVVVAAGRVCALRVYVGMHNPALEPLSALFMAFSAATPQELTEAHDSFTSRFGAMPPQSVTVGYDFIRDMRVPLCIAMGRVKVDICCFLVAPEQRPSIVAWIRQLLATWAFETCALQAFLDDVRAVWGSGEVQFLSLGFAPSLDHVTIYVKPYT